MTPSEGPLLQRGEVLSAISALILLVLLVSTAWYGADASPGRRNGAERAISQTGWRDLSATRWLIVVLTCAAVGSLILHIAERRLRRHTDTSTLVAMLATITALWVTYRTLIDLPAPSSIVDLKLGGYLGMLSAYGVAVGGYQYLRAVRLAAPSLQTHEATALVPSAHAPTAARPAGVPEVDPNAPGAAPAR